MANQEFDERDDLSKARGCINGFKAALLFYLLVFVLWWSCSSCATMPIITRDSGEEINIGDLWIEVAYDVVNRPDKRRAANIYYKECGHLFQIGDRYPDPSKEMLCGY